MPSFFRLFYSSTWKCHVFNGGDCLFSKPSLFWIEYAIHCYYSSFVRSFSNNFRSKLQSNQLNWCSQIWQTQNWKNHLCSWIRKINKRGKKTGNYWQPSDRLRRIPHIPPGWSISIDENNWSWYFKILLRWLLAYKWTKWQKGSLSQHECLKNR